MTITARRRIAFTATGTLVAAAAILFAETLPASNTVTPRAAADVPPAQASLTSGFQDHTSSDYARFQLDTAKPNYGQFIVAIPSIGLLWSDTGGAVDAHSPTSSTLSYDGHGELDAAAVLDTEFGVAFRPQGKITGVTLRLRGQIDPQHGTGAIELWVNGTHYSLNASAPQQDADPTATAVIHALTTQDWAALYTFADSSLRYGLTQAQFTQQLTSEYSGSSVIDVHQTGPITYQTVASGVQYANVPVSMTGTHNGATETANGTVVLIRDGEAWRWFTTKQG